MQTPTHTKQKARAKRRTRSRQVKYAWSSAREVSVLALARRDTVVKAPWGIQRGEGLGAIALASAQLIRSAEKVAGELADEHVRLGEKHHVDARGMRNKLGDVLAILIS